jgi:hypothetical protein
MIDTLNMLMMIVGYIFSSLVGLFLLFLFLLENIDSSGRRYFAWLPKYVLIWEQDYKKGKFIWLRYYQKTARNPEYYALDGSQAPRGINYVTSSRRKKFFG